jgi:hypothetical protein
MNDNDLPTLSLRAACAADDHCITCSDEALSATVVCLDLEAGMAVVAVGDDTADVDISLVDDLQVGQSVLIHGGVAIGLVEDQV